MIARRTELLGRDGAFAEMYADPTARMATAEELDASMRATGVDVAVVAGFWWSDPELAAEHAAYLATVERQAGGRMLAFGPDVAGATTGIGEVRPGNRAREPLVAVARAAGTRPLLVHGSEPAGHGYAGKAGGVSPGELWDLLRYTPARVIGAHWGGGFPFFGLMPEVRAFLAADRLLLDSAASAYLYDRRVFRAAIDLCGLSVVAWGSDFPLRPQHVDRAEVEASLPDRDERRAVLGGNAARFLGLGAAGA